MKLLNKIEALRGSQTYYVSREDGIVIGVTDDKTKIAQIISDEYCDIEVEITDISFYKHDYTYEIKAILTEEYGDKNEYEFTLGTTVKY